MSVVVDPVQAWSFDPFEVGDEVMLGHAKQRIVARFEKLAELDHGQAGALKSV